MKTYEELLIDHENALAALDHVLRCYGELLAFCHKEMAGGYHRIQYQPFEETLH